MRFAIVAAVVTSVGCGGKSSSGNATGSGSGSLPVATVTADAGPARSIALASCALATPAPTNAMDPMVLVKGPFTKRDRTDRDKVMDLAHDSKADVMIAPKGKGFGSPLDRMDPFADPRGSRGRAHVNTPKPTVGGKLAADVVHRVVMKNRARLDYCLAKRLVPKPNLAGTVRVHFIVGPDGRVSGGKATGVDDLLGSCFVDTMKVLAFPAPTEGLADVTYELEVVNLDAKPEAKAPPKEQPKDPKDPKVALPTAPDAKQAPLVPTAPKIVKAWTPYATLPIVPAPALPSKTRAAIAAKLGQVQLCLPEGDVSGDVRAMLQVTPQGVVSAVRAGGFGDAKVESCIASALVQLETGVTDLPTAAEVACDFTIGAKGAQPVPWKVTASDDYATFAVSKTEIKGIPGSLDSKVKDMKDAPPADRVMLLLVDADATYATVRSAIELGHRAPQIIVVDAASRTLLASAIAQENFVAPMSAEQDVPLSRIVSLEATKATFCSSPADLDTDVAALADAAAFATAIKQVLPCPRPCTDAVIVYPAADAPMSALATLRAGLPSVPAIAPGASVCNERHAGTTK